MFPLALLIFAALGAARDSGIHATQDSTTRGGRPSYVEPSLLAADIGSLNSEAARLVDAGAFWVHVDVGDGSDIAGKQLTSLGPASVAAVRRAAPELLIDVHLYTRDPEAHIASLGVHSVMHNMLYPPLPPCTLSLPHGTPRISAHEYSHLTHNCTPCPPATLSHAAAAGADRITFQIEALQPPAPHGSTERHRCHGPEMTAAVLARARALSAAIRGAGCAAGVCLAPYTPLARIEPLVASGDVDLVDVLAVMPGIGGQAFQPEALERVRTLRATHPQLPYIMVDGGIDGTTAPSAAAAGANVLVSGSYLFGAPPGLLSVRLRELEGALASAL
jgi:pentose-5-phosphate-3-epimerase